MDPQETSTATPAATPAENAQQAAPAPEQPAAAPSQEAPVAPSAPPGPQGAAVMPEGDIDRRNILPILIIILVLVAVASGIFWWMGMQKKNVVMEDPIPTQPSQPEEEMVIPPSRSILSLAETNKIISALKNQDLDLFADFVSPTKGVRVSRDSYIDLGTDVVLTQSLIRNANANRALWMWGYSDGKGDPIQDSIYNYITNRIYNHDYINADEILTNELPNRSTNTDFNIKQVYPDADIVEYHFESTMDEHNPISWSSLYLVLENAGGQYYLIGIVNGNWTI